MKHKEEKHTIAVLLRLRQPMLDGTPVHIIITKPRYEALKTLEELNNHDKFLYNEHTCPTNWLGVAYIIAGNDCDPHGIFEHVQTIEIPKDDKGEYIDPWDCEWGDMGTLHSWFSKLPKAAPVPTVWREAMKDMNPEVFQVVFDSGPADFTVPKQEILKKLQEEFPNCQVLEGTWPSTTSMEIEVKREAALKKIKEAIEVNDWDSMAHLTPDSFEIWTASGSWNNPVSITLGDLRDLVGDRVGARSQRGDKS